MQTPGLSLEEVFKRVRVGVARASDDAQIPWESTSLTGSFYFNGKPEQSSAVDKEELAMWESIKTSANLSDFESYIDQYPEGQFSLLARRMIDGLKESSKRDEERRKRVASAKESPVQSFDKDNSPKKKSTTELNLVTPNF
jgi:hypothetical protein